MASLIFDHIGIVTADLDKASQQLAGLLGALEWTDRFDDSGLGVSVIFARDRAGMVYELIAPLGDKSPVAKAVASRKDALNQIAYRTASIADALPALRVQGALPIGPAKPAKAFGGANVQFLMTRLGYIIELVEGAESVHKFK